MNGVLRRLDAHRAAIASYEREASAWQEKIERATLAGADLDSLGYLTEPRNRCLQEADALRARLAQSDLLPDPDGRSTRKLAEAIHRENRPHESRSRIRTRLSRRARARRGASRSIVQRSSRTSRTRQSAARSSSSSDDPGEPEPARGRRADASEHGGEL